MDKYKIGNFEYSVLKNYKDGFSYGDVVSKYTDYFAPYDYILGDYAHDTLRLKGFCEKENSLYRELNAVSGIQDYIKNYCAYECRYFILKKEK